MKGYNEYMENIKTDPALHEKIMSRVRELKQEPEQKAKPARRGVTFFRYAAAVAGCSAIIVLGIITVMVYIETGFQFGHNDFVTPQPYVVPHDNFANVPNGPVNSGPNGIAPIGPNGEPREHYRETIGPHDPPPMPSVIHALAFNTDFTETGGARLAFMPRFSYELTAEQFRAVLPGLAPADFSATVSYTLETVPSEYWRGPVTETVSLIPPDAQIIMTEVGAYCAAGVRIRLGEGGIFDCAIFFDEDPQISYVHGVDVTATIRDRQIVIDGEVLDAHYVRANFMLGEIAYRVSYYNTDENAAKYRVTQLVNQIIYGGAADWAVLADPIIPPLREERMPLSDARLDPDFGAFLPENIPARFDSESAAHRSLNQHGNSLFVGRYVRMGHCSFHWSVRTPTGHDLSRIVSATAREKFDVSLYPIPWAFTVPREIREYFHSPVFLAEEMTLDLVRARTRWSDESAWIDPILGDTSGWRTSEFGVLYGDVLVAVSASGMTAEEIWEMLPQL